MRITAMAAIVAGLALVTSVAGCATSPATHGHGSAGGVPGTPAAAGKVASSTPAGGGSAGPASPASAATQLCGPPDAPGLVITLRAVDGVSLAAIEAGEGARGVVLIPERGVRGKCGWWAFAAFLAAHGYHVLLFDHRCTGASACAGGSAATSLVSDIDGAVARLRQDGAAKVALVGASQGGSEALIAAAVPARGVTGVVALSADELTSPLAGSPYPATAVAAAPRLRLPALLAVAASDPYVSVQDTSSLLARIGSSSKRLVVLGAGAGHGWDLVSPSGPGNAPPALSQTVLAFLSTVTS